MNERLVVLSGTLVNPAEGSALGAADFYQNVPCDLTIVYVCASADTDDTSLTFDINDDGSGAITAIDIADKEDPGEWISTHFGGSETPVRVAAGSELSFDANSATAATTIHYSIWCLTSDVYA